MPTTKRQNAPALSRHGRSASGGAGKAGLNLQFTTQKDPSTAKLQEKIKKNGYGHEQRNPSFPRVSSGIRAAPSKELPPPVARKHSQPPSNAKAGASKPKLKPGFSITAAGDEEEDEWMSSEAGSEAVSPEESSDDEPSPERSRTPVETVKPAPSAQKETALQAATPRAESSMLPRVATIVPPPVVEPQAPAPMKRAPSEVHAPDYFTQRQKPEPAHKESRSEHTSPTHTHHRHEHAKHSAVTRPPSTHSIRADVSLRPHPLIRGHSYGQGVALGGPVKPTPLAPLTVTSGSPVAQMSTSPPGLSTSPSSVRTAYGPQSSPTRRTSVSSAQSAATLPLTPPQMPNKAPDRSRTLSTMSNSSFAALSSLAHMPAASRPPTPQQYTSQFPHADPYHHLESMHPLLPPPYLSGHLTVLATRSPIREAFDRVARARQNTRA